MRPTAVFDPAAQQERVTLYARASFFLSNVLDGFSLTLFCCPFSMLVPVLSSMWCRFFAEY